MILEFQLLVECMLFMLKHIINGKKKNKVIKWFGALRPIDLDTF